MLGIHNTYLGVFWNKDTKGFPNMVFNIEISEMQKEHNSLGTGNWVEEGGGGGRVSVG